MESTYLLLCWLPLFVVLINEWQKKRHLLTMLINKKGVSIEMKDMAKTFIGKECLIYTYNSQITGTVREVSDGAILLDNADNSTREIINFSYIVRIREYPRKKNGKKKSVVFD